MSSSNVGRWSIQTAIDAGGMKTGGAQAIREAKGIESALEGVFGRMGAAMRFPGFSLGFEQLTTGLAAQGVRSFFNQFKESADAAEELGALNNRLGTSVEWLSALQTVAGESGIQTQQFTVAIGKLQQTLGNAVLGSVEARSTFRDLGLDWQRLSGQRFETTFLQVAEALANTGERAMRARLAVELFGREGGRMLRNFQSGAAGVTQAIADVQARGGFISQAGLDSMLQADAAIDRMSTSWSNLWRDFNVAVAPTVVHALDQLRERTSQIREAWNSLSTTRPDLSVPRPVVPQGAETPEQAIARLTGAGLRNGGFGQGFGEMANTPVPDIGAIRGMLAEATAEEQRRQEASTAARAAVPPPNAAGLTARWGVTLPSQAAADMADSHLARARERTAQITEALRIAEAQIAAGRQADLDAFVQGAMAEADHEANIQAERDKILIAAQSPVERFGARLHELNALWPEAERGSLDFQTAFEAAFATIANPAPLETFRRGIQGILNINNLTPQQRGAAARQLIDRLPGLNEQSQLLGSLRADSAEVGQILQGSMTPQVGLMERTVALLESLEEHQREVARVNTAMGADVAFMRQLAGNP